MADQHAPYPPGLTETERRIIDLLREGRPDAEIAVRVGLSTGEVKARIERLIERAGVRNRAALAGGAGTGLTAPGEDAPTEVTRDEAAAPAKPAGLSRRGFIRAGAAVATVGVAAGFGGWALTRPGGGDAPAAATAALPTHTPLPTPELRPRPPATPVPPLDPRDFIRPLADVVRRQVFDLQESIPWSHGIFAMDIEGRRVTGWQFVGQGAMNYRIAPGATAIAWQIGEYEYLHPLHDEGGRTSYQWSLNEMRLVGWTESSYLFARTSEYGRFSMTGQHVLTGLDFAPYTEFGIPPTRFLQEAKFSPDGRRISLWALPNLDTPMLCVFDSFQRQTTMIRIDDPNPPVGQPAPMEIEVFPWGFATGLRYANTRYDAPDLLTGAWSWDGSSHAPVLRLPWNANPSRAPDGRAMVYEQFLRDAPPNGQEQWERWPATVIADADGTPSARIRSAAIAYGDAPGPRRWLADGGGFVAQVSRNPRGFFEPAATRYALFTPDGTFVEEIPLPPPGNDERWFMQAHSLGPVPSPWDTRYIALGRLMVLDRQFGSTLGVQLEAEDGPAHLDPWSAGPGLFVFALPHMGHGAGFPPALLEPRTELPPFSDEVRFVIETPGECAELRPEPSLESPPLACIGNGTAVTPELLPDRRAGTWITQHDSWVHVAAGVEAGWVESRYLRWA